MKKLLGICLLIMSLFVLSTQANYVAAPNYWQNLLEAFFRNPTRSVKEKYTSLDRNRVHSKSIRFSNSDTIKLEFQKNENLNTEVYDEQAVARVLSVAQTDPNKLFELKPYDKKWNIERIDFVLQGNLTPEENKQVQIVLNKKRTFFDSNGKASLFVLKDLNIGDFVIELNSFFNTQKDPIKTVFF